MLFFMTAVHISETNYSSYLGTCRLFASQCFHWRFETRKRNCFCSGSTKFQLKELLAHSKAAIATQKLSLVLRVFYVIMITAIQSYHFRGL